MRASGNNSTPAAPYKIDANAGIEDVHLKVADLQRALDFYSGVLGLEGNATVRRRGGIPRGGPRVGRRTVAPRMGRLKFRDSLRGRKHQGPSLCSG